MIKTTFVLWLVLSVILLLSGCTELKDNLPSPTSAEIKVHESGWADTASANFHGLYLKGKDWQTVNCVACHGSSFDGGTSGRSCFTCHSLYPHSVVFPSAGGHAEYMMSHSYPFSACKTCHGNSYTGGSLGVSCENSGCHVNPNGPEACNTCHGDFQASADTPSSWAPPRAIRGDTLTSAPGVGAHQAHLAAGDIASVISCNQCHTVPDNVSATGHLDSPLPAETKFDPALAAHPSDGNTLHPTPVFDYSTLRCSGTYCHGNWRLRIASSPDDTSRNFMFTDSVMTGANYAPLWTGGQVEAACGSCHGLPPAGHVDLQTDLSACFICHYGSGTMDKAKHINGKVNIFGRELDF